MLLCDILLGFWCMLGLVVYNLLRQMCLLWVLLQHCVGSLFLICASLAIGSGIIVLEMFTTSFQWHCKISLGCAVKFVELMRVIEKMDMTLYSIVFHSLCTQYCTTISFSIYIRLKSIQEVYSSCPTVSLTYLEYCNEVISQLNLHHLMSSLSLSRC